LSAALHSLPAATCRFHFDGFLTLVLAFFPAFLSTRRRLLRLILRCAAVVRGRIGQDRHGPSQAGRRGGREEEVAIHVEVSRLEGWGANGRR
jgi:hypothetical protein